MVDKDNDKDNDGVYLVSVDGGERELTPGGNNVTWRGVTHQRHTVMSDRWSDTITKDMSLLAVRLSRVPACDIVLSL